MLLLHPDPVNFEPEGFVFLVGDEEGAFLYLFAGIIGHILSHAPEAGIHLTEGNTDHLPLAAGFKFVYV